MRRIIPTLLLAPLAGLVVTAAVFLAVDGNLARLTGWYRYEVGMPLFPKESTDQLGDVCWMRISSLHDRIECAREQDGNWWIISPFRDRLSPVAAQAIFSFTEKAKVVDTLPLNNTTRGSLREFGVESSPHTITLKVPSGEHDMTTIARYTLGSASPWLADGGDGETLLPTTYLRTDFYGRDKRIHVVSGNILSIFKDGLSALRDPHPLLFEPDAVRGITLSGPAMLAKGSADRVELTRLSAESPWNMRVPTLTAAEQDNVASLLSRLASLSAIRVEEPEEVGPLGEPELSITLAGTWGEKPLEIHLYRPFLSPVDDQQLCYATVGDRSAVFTLQVEPRVLRRGSYARIVNAVCSLPVLPEKALAQLKSGVGTVYTGDLPIAMEQLRSMRFSDIDPRDVGRVSLRSRYAVHPLRLILIPGDAESQVGDTWMYSAAGARYVEAEEEVVKRFLSGLSDIPVEEILEDVPPGGDMQAAMQKYGLSSPDYVLSILPRPCALRAVLFGVDLPLVRDRAPRSFYIKRYHDPETGQGQWVGMELGSNTITRLSTRMTRSFSLLPETWKKRNIVSFPISALRRLTLGFQEAPLALDYDYIGESWTGTLKGEDITPRINPHRAEYYVRQLQKVRATQWLDREDPQAIAALHTPAFSVKLELEMTDYSDVDAITIDSPSDVSEESIAADGRARTEIVRELLGGTGELDEQMRQMALAERKTRQKTITLEIAPADNTSDQPFFYGRIVETGELFMLNFADAQGLAGSILDM